MTCFETAETRDLDERGTCDLNKLANIGEHICHEIDTVNYKQSQSRDK